jgi:hypothetical protein
MQYDTGPYSIIEVGRRFRSAYCLHHQSVEKAAWEKLVGDIGICRARWILGWTNGETGDDQARNESEQESQWGAGRLQPDAVSQKDIIFILSVVRLAQKQYEL